MTTPTLFQGGNSLVNSDLFKSLLTLNDTLVGGGFGTTRRISLKGSKFRELLNGEQVNVSKDEAMNIVIVDAAPVARTYYEGQYDPNADAVPPTCWSADTQVPSPDVQNPQSPRCADCQWNVKGSGQGNTRACRYSQRLAIAIEGKLDTIYQLQIPATSIFGETKNNAMPMQGYARYLKAHSTPVIAVVTDMRFDEDSDVPKLFFRPVRALSEEELEQVVAMRDHEDTKRAVTFTVSQTDHVHELPAPEAVEEEAPKAKAKAKPVKEEDAPPPIKVTKKTPPPPTEEEDLSAIMGDWDDSE
jgi:hypothetical protein